jgi:hypothetical protein
LNSIYAISLVFLSLLSPRIYPVSAQTATSTPVNPKTSVEAEFGQESTSSVYAYITEQAKKAGVNPIDALWIVSHESQLGQNLVGDDGQSLGYWMISTIYHPEVGRACSLNLQCSTAWSLNWIKKGNIDQWSTWRFRFAWYADENPPL